MLILPEDTGRREAVAPVLIALAGLYGGLEFA